MAFAMIMGGMAMISMVASVTNSGIDAGKNVDSLEKSIKDVNAKTETLEGRWKSLISSSEKERNSILAAMTDDLDELKKLADTCSTNKQDFNENYKNIQIAGVLFVVFIFFILILKEAGIIDDIQNGLADKFKK